MIRQVLQVSLIILVSVTGLDCSWAAEGDRYTNPFNYCRTFGQLAKPDYRYIGANPPVQVVSELKRIKGGAVSESSEPLEEIIQWRCMNRKLYACIPTEELSCSEKADTSRIPSDAMGGYCIENPDAAKIPKFIVERASIYRWGCKSGQPVIVRQFSQVDSMGFLTSSWHEIKDPAALPKPVPPKRTTTKKHR